MEDEDFAFALSLQEEFSTLDDDNKTNSSRKRERPTSIVDECWEIIDPTPDIRQLFLEFNDTYFEGKLAGCEVRWSPRMTLCAGLCCYEGRGGLCSIRLSLPLLKLRPRRDLVQTLLHEMIHALLFVTHNNKDHDAHGAEFHKHMYRINKQSGTNITVYHNFHDEVNLYRQHWWRCNGPCQKRHPYYGMVKRSMNRAPSAKDPWWAEHQQKCGGTFSKVKEPEDYGRKKRKVKNEKDESSGKNISSNSKIPKISDLWKKDMSDVLTKDKENNMQKSNTDNVSPVIPFTGKGFVLGSRKNESSTKTRPWLLDDSSTRSDKISQAENQKEDKNDDDQNYDHLYFDDNNECSEISLKDNTCILKSPSSLGFIELKDGNQTQRNLHKKVKKKKKFDNDGELTIIDAFKRVGNSEKKAPVVIIDDSPNKPENLSSVSNLVSCPVCDTFIQKDKINSHLDNCLL